MSRIKRRDSIITTQEGVTGGEETPKGQVRRAWEMVAEATRRVETLGVQEVAKEWAAGALIVDLRETEERLVHGAIPEEEGCSSKF